VEFFDTNILVYAHDDSDAAKSRIASELILALAANGNGVVSTQVLGEFFQVVTRKIARPLPPADAREALRGYELFRVVQIDVPMVYTATEVVERYRIGYYDALIVAAAARAGCRTIHSEDLNSGQQYLGIMAHNPFDP
jgi:predicted nucleic acid-binding protein